MTNNQKTQAIFGAAIAIIVLAGLAFWYITSQVTETASEQNQAATETREHENPLVQTDSAEYKMYASMTGDEYDRAFLDDMIIHHQGAVEMADLALQYAEREEIKTLSREIITAQAEEITDMERWQQEWGYASGEAHVHDHGQMMGGDHAGHEMMSMSEHMDMMMAELEGKTGAEFDKAWLEQMILHHLGALNMAATGENAKHQELKDLTREIVAAQTKEIYQMQAWQEEWGM